MDVSIEDLPGGVRLELRPGSGLYRIGLSGHDLRDLENAIARYRAGILGRTCPSFITGEGDHACALDEGHDGNHACSGCDLHWLYIKALP